MLCEEAFPVLQYGSKYKHGFHGPDYFDCGGLAWYVYNEILGIDIYEDGYGESATTKIMTSKHGIITLYEEEPSFFKDAVSTLCIN